MKIKLLLILILCSISLTIFAQSNPLIMKVDGHVTPSQQRLIINTLLYINNAWATKGKSIARNITKKYFDVDTVLIINEKKVYSGYDQFDAHFQAVTKNIRGKIRFPLREVMGVDNKLIVQFDEDIYDNNGNYYPTNVMAIFTVHEDRIQQWEEVVNSKYFCQAESSSVVYSN